MAGWRDTDWPRGLDGSPQIVGAVAHCLNGLCRRRAFIKASAEELERIRAKAVCSHCGDRKAGVSIEAVWSAGLAGSGGPTPERIEQDRQRLRELRAHIDATPKLQELADPGPRGNDEWD
ncbi:hypothetical protein [Euryhalocaulis caribicus]|uniref:hypothetical protein n=1 Tax=Euryhalocaulis caribicus TaxID=1161401 RepID=UPI0003A36A66|nr:hypothetical protein [Euryhalocaulis caribicus]